MVVAHVLVEGDDVVGEFLPAGGEHARRRRIAAEEAGDVIGRAAHQAEGRLGPGLREQPPRRADRRGCAGSDRRASTGSPVLGDVNVIRSRISGAAAMS